MGKRVLTLALTLSTMTFAHADGSWSGRALVENSSTVQKQTTGELDATSTLYFYISNKVNENLTVTHMLAGQKELSGQRDQSIISGYLGTSSSLYKSRDVNISLSGRLYIPYNQETRRDTGFQTRLFVNPTLTFNLPELSSFKIYYAPIVTRSFYKYKTSNTGTPNASYAATNRLIFEYLPTELSAIALDIYNSHNWDQYGDRRGDTFNMSIEGEYEIVPSTFIMALGYANSGATFGPRGRETNFNFYDKSGSTIYTNLDFRF